MFEEKFHARSLKNEVTSLAFPTIKFATFSLFMLKSWTTSHGLKNVVHSLNFALQINYTKILIYLKFKMFFCFIVFKLNDFKILSAFINLKVRIPKIFKLLKLNVLLEIF